MKPWTFVANLRTDSRSSLARRSREHAVEPRDDGMKFAKVLKKGTGGLVFGTAEEATAALALLNGAQVGDNTIEADVWETKK